MPIYWPYDLWPINSKTISLLGYLKVIPYTEFEHFGFFRFWVILRTTRQTDRLENLTHADRQSRHKIKSIKTIIDNKNITANCCGSNFRYKNPVIVNFRQNKFLTERKFDECTKFIILPFSILPAQSTRSWPRYILNFLFSCVRLLDSSRVMLQITHRGTSCYCTMLKIHEIMAFNRTRLCSASYALVPPHKTTDTPLPVTERIFPTSKTRLNVLLSL